MKRCPTCGRTYEDDSLKFCLEDGASLLSTPDAHITAPAPSDYYANAPQTEVLPPHRRPTDETSTPQQTIAAVAPVSYPQATSTSEFTQKSNKTIWIIVGGFVAMVLVGTMIGLGYLLFRAKNNAVVAESSGSVPEIQTNANIQTNSNVQVTSKPETTVTPQTNSNLTADDDAPANSNTDTSNIANVNQGTESNVAVDGANLNWLEGVWTGEGYQSDTRTTWTVVLTVQAGTFGINYPNIPCRGTWSLTNKHSRGASFIEYITEGADRCVNNENVMVEKLNDYEISCKYTHAGSRIVVATAVLTKRS